MASPSCCNALSENQQYITCLSIYYRDMICSDGLYLKKSRSACSILGHCMALTGERKNPNRITREINFCLVGPQIGSEAEL